MVSSKQNKLLNHVDVRSQYETVKSFDVIVTNSNILGKAFHETTLSRKYVNMIFADYTNQFKTTPGLLT